MLVQVCSESAWSKKGRPLVHAADNGQCAVSICVLANSALWCLAQGPVLQLHRITAHSSHSSCQVHAVLKLTVCHAAPMLNAVHVCDAGQQSAANSASVPSRMHSMASNSSFLGLPSAMSRASSQALGPSNPPNPPSAQPNLSKWRPLSWRTSSRSLASSASFSSSPSSSSLPALPPDVLMRKPFVLRLVSALTHHAVMACLIVVVMNALIVAVMDYLTTQPCALVSCTSCLGQ